MASVADADTELTPAQKAAITRARNKALKASSDDS